MDPQRTLLWASAFRKRVLKWKQVFDERTHQTAKSRSPNDDSPPVVYLTEDDFQEVWGDLLSSGEEEEEEEGELNE